MPVPGRHHAEIVECACAPAQELVALLVALVFDLDVLLERVGRAEEIHLDGMVDDEVDGNQRIDLGRIAVQVAHGIAHGGQVDDGGHAGEVLHQHARRPVGDFPRGGLGLEPLGHGADVVGLDRAPVLEPQQVFQQHFQGEWKVRDPGQPVPFRIRQREVFVGLGADGQRLAALEAVGMGRGRAHEQQSP